MLVQHRKPVVGKPVKVVDGKGDRHVVLQDYEVARHMVLGLVVDIALVQGLDDVIHTDDADQPLAHDDG
ncbi:hypothetical protein SDC9_188373 [bioreactor metagenome]|uniref:Uncharacterized protein n=1 Tax=bioreactor metagenome TaxID=1076179 RepID=A0A645HZX4_9ZZZZ